MFPDAYGLDNYEYQCQSHPVSTYGEANKLWLTIREKELRKCLYFVNLCGCENDYWNKGKGYSHSAGEHKNCSAGGQSG